MEPDFGDRVFQQREQQVGTFRQADLTQGDTGPDADHEFIVERFLQQLDGFR